MANDRIPQCEKIRRYTGIVIVRTRPVERTIVPLEKKIRSKDWGLRIRRNIHVLRISNIIQKQLLCSCPFDEAEDSNPIGFEIGIYLKRPCILQMKTIPLGASDRTTHSRNDVVARDCRPY